MSTQRTGKHRGVAVERRIVRWCLLAYILPLLAGFCSAGQIINFNSRTELPDIGLSLQLMSGARALPSPSPRVYRYTVTQGPKSWKEERFNPLELWQADQHVGTWRGKDGATLRIAIPRLAPAELLANGHITRDAYQKTTATLKRAKWDKAALGEWVAAFTQTEPPTFTPMSPPAMRIYRVYTLTLTGAPNTLAYLMLPRHDPSFAQKNGKPWVYIEITLPADTNLEATARNARRNLLGSCRPLPTSMLSRGPIHDFNKPPAAPTSIAEGSTKYEQSKDAARASIRNLEGWWFDETRYYIILSNQQSQKRRLVEDLRSHMDRLQEAYRAMIPPWDPITDASVLRVFREAEEYQDYVGKDLHWSDGVWLPSRRELVVRPASRGSSRDRHDTMMQIVRHEGFHQYLFYALDKVETSPWFNEGHACLYESIALRRDKLQFTEDARKATLLANAARTGKLAPSRMFGLSYPAFYAKDNATRDRHYAMAWGLIYYLRRAAPLSRPDRFSAMLPNYLKALQQERSPSKATRSALQGVDLKALDADFNAFWKSPSRRSAAIRNRN